MDSLQLFSSSNIRLLIKLSVYILLCICLASLRAADLMYYSLLSSSLPSHSSRSYSVILACSYNDIWSSNNDRKKGRKGFQAQERGWFCCWEEEIQSTSYRPRNPPMRHLQYPYKKFWLPLVTARKTKETCTLFI